MFQIIAILFINLDCWYSGMLGIQVCHHSTIPFVRLKIVYFKTCQTLS